MTLESKNDEKLKGSMAYRSVSTPQEALIAITDAVNALEARAQITNPKMIRFEQVMRSFDSVETPLSRQHYSKKEDYPYRSISSYVRYDSNKGETILTTSYKDHEIMQRYALYKDVIEKFMALYTERHKENLPAIENNKKVRARIVEFMDAVGVPKECYKSIKSGRSTKSVKCDSDWYKDICNKILITDGYDDAISRCKNDLQSLEKYHNEYLTYKSKLESETKARKQFADDFKLMSKLSAKYDRDSTDFYAVTQAICSQNPFLQIYDSWKNFDFYDNDSDSIRYHLHEIKDLNKEIYDDILDACDEFDSNGDDESIQGVDWLAVSKQVPDDLFMEYKAVDDIDQHEFNKRFKEL